MQSAGTIHMSHPGSILGPGDFSHSSSIVVLLHLLIDCPLRTHPLLVWLQPKLLLADCPLKPLICSWYGYSFSFSWQIVFWSLICSGMDTAPAPRGGASRGTPRVAISEAILSSTSAGTGGIGSSLGTVWKSSSESLLLSPFTPCWLLCLTCEVSSVREADSSEQELSSTETSWSWS